jgi:hypothetical protein
MFYFKYLCILRQAILLFLIFHRMARLWNYGARIRHTTPIPFTRATFTFVELSFVLCKNATKCSYSYSYMYVSRIDK